MSQAHATNPPNLLFVMTIHVAVAPPLEVGEIHGSDRRIVPIMGGTFDGPRLAGTVLPHGADWQYTRSDGVLVVEARYTLRTDQGQLISVINRGFRHGAADLATRLASGTPVPTSEYYFMTSPMFETAAPELQWMSRLIFVATGERLKDSVVINVWQAGDDPDLSPSALESA